MLLHRSRLDTVAPENLLLDGSLVDGEVCAFCVVKGCEQLDASV